MVCVINRAGGLSAIRAYEPRRVSPRAHNSFIRTQAALAVCLARARQSPQMRLDLSRNESSGAGGRAHFLRRLNAAVFLLMYNGGGMVVPLSHSAVVTLYGNAIILLGGTPETTSSS